MTFKRQARIGFRHAFPVINNLYGSLTCINDLHLYVLCPCIDSILNQFLDDRCRTLYDLTGCNLIGYRIGQELYNIAHKQL